MDNTLIGNGSAGGDEYDFKWFHWAGKCSEVGLTAGTTYYVRAIGQKHSTSNTVIFAGSQGNGNDHKLYECSTLEETNLIQEKINYEKKYNGRNN